MDETAATTELAIDPDRFYATKAELERLNWELANAQALLESARRDAASAAKAAKAAGHRTTDIARLLGVNRATADKWST